MRGFLGYVLYRFLAGIFGLLPHPLVVVTSRGLGRSLSYIATDRLALLRRHLRRIHGDDLSEGELTSEAREMFASYGRYWGEVFWFRPRRRQWAIDSTEIDGREAVLAANAEGRGVVLAICHLGNWEAAATAAESIGLPIVSVAEELPNHRITDWFIKTRGAFGIEILIAGRGSVMTGLTRALKRGKTVALVADRDVTGRGIEVEFFGENTKMPGGPAALADLTGAALFPVGTYFEGDGFRLVAHPELELDASIEDREERVLAATQALARKFEEIIERAPTQWHLFQPNWPSDEAWLEERR